MSLNNKVAIVTGAGSGMGAAIAKKFSNEGARVVLVDKNEIRVNAVASQCKDTFVIKADLTNDEDVVRIVNETVKKFGKIDILVNNAGIVAFSSVLEGDLLKAHDDVMNVNFRAVVHLTKLSAPHLIKSKGNIINISSVGGQSTLGVPDLMIYCASKAALNVFSRDVALELAPYKVRVNLISPGPVRTNILESTNLTTDDFRKKTALDRVSEPEEIAELALYLASEKAESITGSNVVADNGMSIR